jgi:histidinol-phosphate aminotransferase
MQAIQQVLAGRSRYTGAELAELTNDIAARRNASPEHIVLGEILDVLGLYLSARGSPDGEFVYSEPGWAILRRCMPSRPPAAWWSAFH